MRPKVLGNRIIFQGSLLRWKTKGCKVQFCLVYIPSPEAEEQENLSYRAPFGEATWLSRIRNVEKLATKLSAKGQ